MGSHQKYTHRYPSSYKKFKISDVTKNVGTYKKYTIATYDNSVLYNDYIVNEIIKRFESKETIIFYFPDHGEEVYDTKNFTGHGYNNPSIPMINIPFFVWTSSKFNNH